MSIVRTAYAFSPTSISNCALWLDAADSSTITVASSNVTNVADKSGNGTVLSNATGFTYPNNSFNGSYPSFLCSSGGIGQANNAARLGYNSAFAQSTPFTVFFVSHQIQAGTAGYIMDSQSGGSRQYTYETTLNTPFGSSATNITSSPSVVSMTWISGTSVLYLNGTSNYSGALGSFTTGGIIVGNRFSINESWPGHICELIYYSGQLGTTQRQQVEGYLAQKWGLTASLPPGHPGLTSRIYRSDYLVPNKVKPVPYYTQFSPRQIPGCSLWLDGTDPAGNGVVPSAGALATWVDKSGSGNNATQSTGGNQPTYSNNGLIFSGSQWYQTQITSFPTAESIFIVFRTTTGVADIFAGTTLNSREVLLYTGNKIFLGAFGNDPSSTTPNSGVISLNTNILYSVTYTSSAITFNVNGSTTGSGSPPFTFSGTGTSWIGSSGYSPNNMNGTIYEFIYYNSSLSSTLRQQIESYLAQKWGLTTSLPVGHSHLTQQAGAVTTVANTKFKVTGLPRVIVATVATGGTITTVGSYRFHTFTYPGGTFIVSANPSTVQALVVGGGGGGGGYYNGGGGGAGGALFNSAFSIGVGSYTVTIGNGGAGASGGNNPGINGTSGGATTFSTLTGNGGGGGGADNNVNGLTGGCGGGMGPLGASAPGSGNQGYAGGYGTNGPNMGTLGGAYGSGYGGGGGGGMGSVGSNALTSAGPGYGGTGYTYVVGGQNYLVAGGGGGGTADTDNTNFGLGGSSIGGVGGLSSARVAGNGTANTGSGGGGYGRVGTGSAGGSGGTGIVVIAYRIL